MQNISIIEKDKMEEKDVKHSAANVTPINHAYNMTAIPNYTRNTNPVSRDAFNVTSVPKSTNNKVTSN